MLLDRQMDISGTKAGAEHGGPERGALAEAVGRAGVLSPTRPFSQAGVSMDGEIRDKIGDKERDQAVSWSDAAALQSGAWCKLGIQKSKTDRRFGLKIPSFDLAA